MTIISSFQEKKSASLMQSGTNVKYDPISWVNWSRQKSYNVCFSTRTLKKKSPKWLCWFSSYKSQLTMVK